MKNSEILKAAKDLISNPLHWMQGDYTNDERNCFCGIGAIVEVTGLTPYDVMGEGAESYLRLAARKLDQDHNLKHSFAPYNDSHTHDEVLHAFDLAISLAEAEEV